MRRMPASAAAQRSEPQAPGRASIHHGGLKSILVLYVLHRCSVHPIGVSMLQRIIFLSSSAFSVARAIAACGRRMSPLCQNWAGLMYVFANVQVMSNCMHARHRQGG